MVLKSLDIHLTNKCNLYCQHCLYSSGKVSSNVKELSGSHYKKIFSDFKSLSRGLGSVNFLGGEPLVRADCFNIFKIAKDEGLKVNLISNFRVSEDTINKINDFKFNRLSFGIHGKKENHDWLRDSYGDYNHTINILKRFATSKNRGKINITSVLHKNNINDIEMMLEISKDYEVDSHSFFFFTPVGRGKRHIDLMITPREWEEAKLRVERWIYENDPSFKVSWERAYMKFNELKYFNGGLCSGNQTSSIEIRSNGNVYFCGILSSVNGPSLGNLKELSLIDIYKNISCKRIQGVSGCTALAILNNEENGKLIDIRDRDEQWLPTCPYELDEL